jgi:hypothetical protein
VENKFQRNGRTQMNLPHDMKGFKGQEWDDGFQLIPPTSAGWALLTLVALACILEPLFRAG